MFREVGRGRALLAAFVTGFMLLSTLGMFGAQALPAVFDEDTNQTYQQPLLASIMAEKHRNMSFYGFLLFADTRNGDVYMCEAPDNQDLWKYDLGNDTFVELDSTTITGDKTYASLRCGAVANDGSLLFALFNSTIYRSTDGGATLEPVFVMNQGSTRTICTRGDYVYVAEYAAPVESYSSIWMSTDNGKPGTWVEAWRTPIETIAGSGSNHWHFVYTDPYTNYVYAGAGDENLVNARSTDGIHWEAWGLYVRPDHMVADEFNLYFDQDPYGRVIIYNKTTHDWNHSAIIKPVATTESPIYYWTRSTEEGVLYARTANEGISAGRITGLYASPNGYDWAFVVNVSNPTVQDNKGVIPLYDGQGHIYYTSTTGSTYWDGWVCRFDELTKDEVYALAKQCEPRSTGATVDYDPMERGANDTTQWASFQQDVLTDAQMTITGVNGTNLVPKGDIPSDSVLNASWAALGWSEGAEFAPDLDNMTMGLTANCRSPPYAIQLIIHNTSRDDWSGGYHKWRFRPYSDVTAGTIVGPCTLKISAYFSFNTTNESAWTDGGARFAAKFMVDTWDSASYSAGLLGWDAYPVYVARYGNMSDGWMRAYTYVDIPSGKDVRWLWLEIQPIYRGTCRIDDIQVQIGNLTTPFVNGSHPSSENINVTVDGINYDVGTLADGVSEVIDLPSPLSGIVPITWSIDGSQCVNYTINGTRAASAYDAIVDVSEGVVYATATYTAPVLEVLTSVTVDVPSFLGETRTTEPLLSVSVTDGLCNHSFTSWDNPADYYAWTAEADSEVVTYTLAGVTSETKYRLFVDGVPVKDAYSTGYGVVTFTYFGPWSSHDFEIQSVSSTSSYGNSDKVLLWCRPNGSSAGDVWPGEGYHPSNGMNYFGTDYVLVAAPGDGVWFDYTWEQLNSTDYFPSTAKIVVQHSATANSASLVANAAKNNSRIVGMLLDDFPVGEQSPSNMSAIYSALHHEDANLTQGPLALQLTIYQRDYYGQSPYTWASVLPYFDEVQFWYYPLSYSNTYDSLIGFEDSARDFATMVPGKTIWLGIYLHYYDLGTPYPYDAMAELLEQDARLIEDGIAQGITILETFWIQWHPEAARLVQNFVNNEWLADWETTWDWATDEVTTTRGGVAASDGIHSIITIHGGNKTFISDHHQKLTITNFVGANATFQIARTGDIPGNITQVGSTVTTWISPNEKYKAWNLPVTTLEYSGTVYMTSPTSWDNRAVYINGTIYVDTSLWANNTIIRVGHDNYNNTIKNGTIPWMGIVFNSTVVRVQWNNVTIEPIHRTFPYYFFSGNAGTTSIFYFNNFTKACPGVGWQARGYTYVRDCWFYHWMPNGQSGVADIYYAPSKIADIVYARNTEWCWRAPHGYSITWQPGQLDSLGLWDVRDNKRIGGRYGMICDGSVAKNTTFDGHTISRSETPLASQYTEYSFSTYGADRLMNITTGFRMETDVSIAGTLYDGNGALIGYYESSNGWLNVSDVMHVQYDAVGATNYVHPWNWEFYINGSLPDGYYYVLEDNAWYSRNRSVWGGERYLPCNGTIVIRSDYASDFALRQVPLRLDMNTTNYVSPNGTLCISDKYHYWSDYSYMASDVTSLSATSSGGVLTVVVQEIASGYARWSASATSSATSAVFTAYSMTPNATYDLFVDTSKCAAGVAADGSGAVSFTYAGPWSTHTFVIQSASSSGDSLSIDFTISKDKNKVVFTSITTGNPISIRWSFGDGTGSSDWNPTHIYTSKGLFTVTVIVTDSVGNTERETKIIDISELAEWIIDDDTVVVDLGFTTFIVTSGWAFLFGISWIVLSAPKFQQIPLIGWIDRRVRFVLGAAFFVLGLYLAGVIH